MTDEADRRATQVFEVRNILARHCGELLTPAKVDQIVAEFARAMTEGGCAWAFTADPSTKPQNRTEHG